MTPRVPTRRRPPGRGSTASSETLAIVAFALLVLATVGAFFVTQRLKSGQPVVKRLALQRFFSPNGDHRKDSARISFDLPKGDRVTVDVVNANGDRVRRLIDGRALSRGVHSLTWNGHADDGTVPPDGTYYVRVTLRRQGRAATGVRGVELVTSSPRPRIVSVRPSHLSARDPAPVRIRFTGPSVVRPVYGIWRTDLPRPRRVATITGPRQTHSATWDARIHGRPAPAGDYAVSVTVQNRALVEGSAPRKLPPTRSQARPGTGFTVSGTTAMGPLEPLRAGGVVRIAVRGGAHRFRWSVNGIGRRTPLRRGRGAGAELAFRMPARSATGEYVVEIAAGGRPARVPVTVKGRRTGRVLVVVPTMAWQGSNLIDDDADGFADTLYDSRRVPLARPFAGGALPPGLTGQVGPLMRFLDAARTRYDITTDLALARDHGPRLAGHSGVALVGDEPWLTPGLAAELRGYVQAGGRVASFGADSLRRRVSVGPAALLRPTPPARVNALGEATRLVGGQPASLAASADTLSLFGGTDGVVGPFTRFDESLQLPPGSRALTAAGRPPGRTALVAYRLGRGLVVRLGTPDWARSLTSVPATATVTRTVWALLSR